MVARARPSGGGARLAGRLGAPAGTWLPGEAGEGLERAPALGADTSHLEAFLPRRGGGERGISTVEAGGERTLVIQHGYRRRRASGRIPLCNGWQASGCIRGPAGGGGVGGVGVGAGGACVPRRLTVRDKHPRAGTCGLRTGLLFAPAAFYRSSAARR